MCRTRVNIVSSILPRLPHLKHRPRKQTRHRRLLIHHCVRKEVSSHEYALNDMFASFWEQMFSRVGIFKEELDVQNPHGVLVHRLWCAREIAQSHQHARICCPSPSNTLRGRCCAVKSISLDPRLTSATQTGAQRVNPPPIQTSARVQISSAARVSVSARPNVYSIPPVSASIHGEDPPGKEPQLQQQLSVEHGGASVTARVGDWQAGGEGGRGGWLRDAPCVKSVWVWGKWRCCCGRGSWEAVVTSASASSASPASSAASSHDGRAMQPRGGEEREPGGGGGIEAEHGWITTGGRSIQILYFSKTNATVKILDFK